MARMPDAIWKPISTNYSRGACGRVVGMVVHHMVGSESSAFALFDRPGSGASAHFGVCYDGTTYQYVDTADAAYHACQANYAGQIGVENESASSGDLWAALTDAQVSACARIAAWLAAEHGIELRVADPDDRRGVGYHSMVPGDCSVAWGQTGCPGEAIVAQRGEMVRRARDGDGGFLMALTDEEQRRLLDRVDAMASSGIPVLGLRNLFDYASSMAERGVPELDLPNLFDGQYRILAKLDEIDGRLAALERDEGTPPGRR